MKQGWGKVKTNQGVPVMKRWWVSWEEPTSESGGDWRPLKVPPTESIPKYWCSGYGGWDEDSYASICAVVDAPSEDEAKALVEKYWRPQEWRFCNERELDWRPAGDRFPWGDND
jgi:hypothetical protein